MRSETGEVFTGESGDSSDGLPLFPGDEEAGCEENCSGVFTSSLFLSEPTLLSASPGGRVGRKEEGGHRYNTLYPCILSTTIIYISSTHALHHD